MLSTFDASSKKSHTCVLLYRHEINQCVLGQKLLLEWRAQQKAELDPQNALIHFTGQCKSLHRWSISELQFLKAHILNRASTWKSFPIICPPRGRQAPAGSAGNADFSGALSSHWLRKQCCSRHFPESLPSWQLGNGSSSAQSTAGILSSGTAWQ